MGSYFFRPPTFVNKHKFSRHRVCDWKRPSSLKMHAYRVEYNAAESTSQLTWSKSKSYVLLNYLWVRLMGKIGTPCRHDVPFGMQIHDSKMKSWKVQHYWTKENLLPFIYKALRSILICIRHWILIKGLQNDYQQHTKEIIWPAISMMTMFLFQNNELKTPQI